MYLKIILSWTIVSVLITYGARDEEGGSSAEQLQPLKYSKNMDFRDVYRKLHIYFPVELSRKEIIEGIRLRMYQLWSQIPDKYSIFGNEFKEACQSDCSLDAIRCALTALGHRVCHQKCKYNNRKYVGFADEKLQRFIRRAKVEEDRRRSADESIAYSIKEARVIMKPIDSESLSECVKRRYLGGYSCRCKPQYKFMVNSHFQHVFDKLLLSGKSLDEDSEGHQTRGIWNVLLSPLPIDKLIATIVTSILNPEYAIQGILSWTASKINQVVDFSANLNANVGVGI